MTDELAAWLLAQLDEADRREQPLGSWNFPFSRAERDAKRRIVAIHIPQDDGPDQADSCWTCEGEEWPCPTLRLLALPYAGRPGYREEWRP